MRYAVYRVDEESRATLEAHLLALSAVDRRLRFGMALAPEMIAAYVDRIDFGHDAVFGVRDAAHALVGAVHVAMADDHAELGLSVLAAHRRRGVGEVLLHRAVSHARNRSVPKVLMHCAADNQPILRLLRKFGMDIASRGIEVVAQLDLRPAFVAPVAREFAGLSMAA